MSISAKQVQELRERTGAGMMECKKALVEVNGNIDSAIELMRKRGQAKADKKADCIAAEGVIAVGTTADAKRAVMIEINSQTDFVARDDNFKRFVAAVLAAALQSDINDLATLMAQPNSNADDQNRHDTIEQARQQLVAKIGENIQVRRFVVVQGDDLVAAYVHGDRIGVLVQLQGGNLDLAKDLAMHIVASNPQVIAAEEVAPELIAKEREIFMAQATASGKPMDVVEKMIEGRIKKFLDETSLLGQPFVKDPNINVATLLKRSNAQVIKFVRYAVGEGIEKKVENFAEEVMAQVRGS